MWGFLSFTKTVENSPFEDTKTVCTLPEEKHMHRNVRCPIKTKFTHTDTGKTTTVHTLILLSKLFIFQVIVTLREHSCLINVS